MSRTMYDAVDANAIPSSGFDLLAGYINGHYPSYFRLRERFPHATVVPIDVLNRPGELFHDPLGRVAPVMGRVLDIEKGDARPDEAASWCDRSRAAGIARPTPYFSTSDLPAVRANMGTRKFDAWIAEYGPKLHAASDSQLTIVAWQKIDHGPHGENIDISDVYDPYWPLAAPPPMPPPKPTPPSWEEIDMSSAKQDYIRVPVGGDGKGVFDLGLPNPPIGVVPDLDVRNHPGFAFGTTKLPNGHHAVTVVGAPAGQVGFYVTVAD